MDGYLTKTCVTDFFLLVKLLKKLIHTVNHYLQRPHLCQSMIQKQIHSSIQWEKERKFGLVDSEFRTMLTFGLGKMGRHGILIIGLEMSLTMLEAMKTMS